MALYAYKAVNNNGEVEDGLREVADEAALISELQTEGFIPLHVSLSKGRSFLGLRLGAKQLRLSQKEVLMLTGELATLLDSGLPLDKSLSVLIDLTEENEKLSKLLTRVLEKVKGGTSLADALQSQAGVFSKFYLNMIRAGEAGGNLGGVLVRLSDYLERSRELMDTVSTALIYPIILMIMSFA